MSGFGGSLFGVVLERVLAGEETGRSAVAVGSSAQRDGSTAAQVSGADFAAARR